MNTNVIYNIKMINKNIVNKNERYKAAKVIQDAWRKYKKRFVYIELGDM